MWPKYIEVLALLSTFKVKWKWIPKYEEAFQSIRALIFKEYYFLILILANASTFILL